MTLVSRRDYAFILNRHPFPNPFLVEISRRTKTQRKNVAFYLPDVVFCPQQMKSILEAILYDESLFKHHRQVVKVAMVEALTEHTTDGGHLESASLVTIAVEAIIKEEIWKFLHPDSNDTRNTCTGTGSIPLATRSQTNFIAKLMGDWRMLRTKRLKIEEYLRYSFAEDVQRSKSELAYVCHGF